MKKNWYILRNGKREWIDHRQLTAAEAKKQNEQFAEGYLSSRWYKVKEKP